MSEYTYPLITELMRFWLMIVFILGCCIGSFLNVVIYRIPAEISLITPGSHCPQCKEPVRWYQNIPLLSWLVLGGRCASCSCRIPIRYFLVEFLTGVMFLLVFGKAVMYHEPLPALIIYFGLTMLVITTAFIDFEHQIIPDKTTYPAILLGLGTAAAFPVIWGSSSHWRALLESTVCMVLCAGLLSLFAIIGYWIFKRDALGWGDVKYMAAIGACLGGKAAYFTLLFGALAGSFAGIWMIARKKKNFAGSISFGPFLAVGTYLWILFDHKILELYESIFRKLQ
ncbi:MAG: prepilin peptidase [Victivallales bacterium]|nr:prepilin peptidase [Victivallales bacterium]